MTTSFPVYLTGIRPGETIIASQKSLQNQGSELIVYGSYPPSKKALENLDESQWPSLLAFLAALPFFAAYDNVKIKKWLLANATEQEDVYLNDLDLIVRPIALTGSLFESSLDDTDKEKFLQDNSSRGDGHWPLQDIYRRIKPKNLNSKARYHTLVFRPSIWTVKVPGLLVRSYSGMVFVLSTNGEFSFRYEADYSLEKKETALELRLLPELPIAALLEKGKTKLMLGDLFKLVKELTKIEQDEIDAMYNLISWAPPSFHKSLMQKIIRTGAREVDHEKRTYQASALLLVSFATLLLHPGAFVPQLQTFISGAEGALKRLFVTIAEDSYTQDANTLLSLLIGAYLVKIDKSGWQSWCSLSMVRKWMQLALGAHQDLQMYNYKTKKLADLKLDRHKFTAYEASYLVLQQLKSFYTDINLVSWMAKSGGTPRDIKASKLMQSIPLVHCVDQHVWPELAYFCPLSLSAQDNGEKGGDPQGDFVSLYCNVWDRSSGVNPRKENYFDYHSTMETTKFINELRKAQIMLFLAKQPALSKQGFVYLNQVVMSKTYKLEDSWLAGLVGPITVKSGRTFFVSIDPHDISQRKVMLRPSRDKKSMSTPVSEEEKQKAIEKFDKELEKGVKCLFLSTIPWFKNAMIYAKHEGYEVKLSSEEKKIPWHKVKKIEVELDIVADFGLSLQDSLVTRSAVKDTMPVVKDGMKQAFEIVSALPVEQLNRLLILIAGNSAAITFPSVNRLGKTTVNTRGDNYGGGVRRSDVPLYELVSKLCCLVPFALQRAGHGNLLSFNIKFGPFVSDLRKHIVQLLNNQVEFIKWPEIYSYWHEEGRELQTHQAEIASAMIESSNSGYIIDIPTGGGKTAIVGEFIRLLAMDGRLPPYVVYTLPPSAIDSVTKELERFELKVNLLDARKTKKQHVRLERHQVNLVRHDHLKNAVVTEAVRGIIAKCLFVVDEFHLALNQTKRTTACLELARLSYLYICLSGTPIKDSHTNQLIPWLEPVVSFQVTEENLWTAVAGMLSRRMTLPVKILEKKIEAPMPLEDEASMQKLLAKHDPSALNTAFNLCFTACREKMIKLALARVKKGHRVFLVAKNREDQEIMAGRCREVLDNKEIYPITGDSPLTLEGDYEGPIKIVISTYRHSTGYTLSACNVLITSVYFADETVRKQLVGRLVRLSQKNEEVSVITVYAGVLGDVLTRYEKIGSLSLAQKSMAEEIAYNGD